MFWRSLQRLVARAPQRRRDRPTGRTVLGLEPLEDRLALATVSPVTVELDGDNNLVVTGSDKADTVIIEQRGKYNSLVYVTVNGKAQNKGKAYDIQGGKIIVDLGAGNDSLTIRAQKGKGFVEGTTEYDINLGDGNDTFVFAPNSMTAADLLFSNFDLGAGNDKATFTPGAMNAGSLKWGTFLGGDGNDVFTLNMTTTRNYSVIGVEGDGYIDLGDGADTFALSWTTLVDADVDFASDFYTVGVDMGMGADKVNITKGNVTRGTVDIAIDLGDYFETGSNETETPDGTNTATIAGSGIITEGAVVNWGFYGGSGKDGLTFDDDRILYDNTLVTVTIDTADGDDVVSFNMNSNKSKFEGIGTADETNAAMEIEVALGAGKDKFTQTFDPKYWRLQNGGSLTTAVDGGEGDDEIRINKSGSALLNLDGTFDIAINAAAGVDLVDINLGNVLRIGVNYFHIDVRTDGGKDTVNMTLVFDPASRTDPTYADATAVIDVRTGNAVDTVYLNINNKSAGLTVFVNANGGGQVGDKLTKLFSGNIKGVLKGFDGLPNPPVDPTDPTDPTDPDPPTNPPGTGTGTTTSSTTTTPTATGAVATSTIVTTSAKETIITTVNTVFDKTTGAATTTTNTTVVPLDGDPAPDSATNATTLTTTTPTGKVVTTILTTILAGEIKTTTITTTTNTTAGTATTTTATTSTPRT